jgi:ABC-type multidrug transport system ATPase subunit
MDLEAKRSMWSAIKRLKGNSSKLLTTHSMDEAE